MVRSMYGLTSLALAVLFSAAATASAQPACGGGLNPDTGGTLTTMEKAGHATKTVLAVVPIGGLLPAARRVIPAVRAAKRAVEIGRAANNAGKATAQAAKAAKAMEAAAASGTAMAATKLTADRAKNGGSLTDPFGGKEMLNARAEGTGWGTFFKNWGAGIVNRLAGLGDFVTSGSAGKLGDNIDAQING